MNRSYPKCSSLWTIDEENEDSSKLDETAEEADSESDNGEEVAEEKLQE